MEGGDPRAFQELLDSLVGFVGETAEIEDGALAYVHGLSVELPFELYVRRADDGPGAAVAAIEGYTAQSTETTVLPVFHRLRIRVEVEGAGEFQPRLES